MWKWKMVSGVITSVPERVVCEHALNIEEFRTIGITQRFEEIGWERVLDWCEDITSRVYFAAVCEWLSTLRFVNMDGPAPTWQLIGNIGKNRMIMSCEHMNAIAQYDSLGVEAYDYYELDHFLDNKTNTADPDQMLVAVLPGSGGMSESRNDLSLEGRILQGISLENVMVRFRDRAKVKAPDCRVLHALFYGSPRLSWRQVVMINTWDMRESCTRKMIPYVRQLSAMILQQNALPQESLWVSKPIDQFNFASMKRHWKITVKVFGYLHTVEDEQGNNYTFSDPSAAQGGAHDEVMVDEEDETEPAGPRGPRQRYMRPIREISEDVANFVNRRRVPSYQNFNRGQHEVFDNVYAVMGEGR
ncbi:hypothetical protein HanXRQr2_Chr08g0331341 [Helianthus annuus]|uniref:Uncharacterized protein n=1 Tax=Helianthus annuus TaxID=4232 RepID=A0A9K3NC18_HELAN|nr:hypothetical protein HanXRQr2_Chr08g0331341 [Helianthus annuus]KAJ0538318.1 hypothetical protein HanHA300_Chr08g0273621 [Helianthus annuus]KAJ0546179.1 hypothetical protein HanIR_Chr08g0358021 [Helianthus annuus]KAJ0718629.1 hypothetical protein HanLR1_Chr08g0272721 [Helianthus annuus]KAJ0721872.1 hypothetical protein HanOQP8_Chr08g0280341 [Helianthus annuus]